MIAHKYEVKYCEDMFHQMHGAMEPQTVIYVPRFAAFAFRNGGKIDFFSEELGNPEKFGETMEEIGEKKYLGEVELNDEDFFKFLDAGKELEGAKKVFIEASKSLLDKLK